MFRRSVDLLIGALCRILLGLFFRRLEVVGRSRVPRRGPLVVVANHVNGLIDPMFLLGPLRLPARMLGKHTLWKIPVLAQILDLAGVLPVYRRQDEGGDRAKNLETFARSHELLAAGGILAIFPEGISHDAPSLQPLRTGAARIVLEAEQRFGPLGCRILPVGLLFEERERFRSRALVVVGRPVDPGEEVELARRDEATAVRLLTERIAEALARVTLGYSSWEEARLVERGADVLEVSTLELPRRRRLAATFDTRRSLLDGLAWLRRRHPAAVEAAASATREYDALLAAARLTDPQVVATYPVADTLASVLGALVRGILAAPVALVGIVLNLVPYLAVALIARQADDEPNQVATYKLFPSLLAYPATWAIEAGLAAASVGARGALALLVVAPLTGYVAVRFLERQEAFWRETRAYLRLRRKRAVVAELRRQRQEVERRIGELVELWAEAQAYEPDSRRS